jgi:hypothetical protein
VFVVLGHGCADSRCRGSDKCADPPASGSGTEGTEGTGSGDGGSGDGSLVTSGGDADPSSGAGSTVSVDDTTSAGDTSAAASSGSSSAGDSGSDSSADTGTTGPLSELEYQAVAIPGGLDRVRVFGHHPTEDWCVWITAVTPSQVSAFPIETTKNWAVESIRISDVGEACGAQSPDMFGAENATAASGTLELYDGVPFPCLVDVDVTTEFEGLLPGIPGTVEMLAVAIPVTGC